MSDKNLYRAHLEWARRAPDERFQSLAELAKVVGERRQASIEADVTGKQLAAVKASVDAQGNLVLGGHRPTHWSFSQVAGLIGAPSGYLRDLPQALVVENINHGIAHRLHERESDFKLLVGTNGGSALRAVTSGKYARIWDHEVVRAILEHGDGFVNPPAFKDGKWGAELVPSGLYASDHDVFALLVNDQDRIDVGGRSLGRGFMAWNSETGGATFGWTTFLNDYTCSNHIVWGAAEVVQRRVRHVGKTARQAILEDFPAAIMALRKRGGKMAEAEALKAAMQDVLAKTEAEAVEVLGKRGFTRTESVEGAASAIREESRAPFTRFGMLSGLTAYARSLPFMDVRVDLERRAAKSLLPVLTGVN